MRKDFLFFLRFIQTDPLPPTPLDLRHIAAGGAAAGGGEGEIGLVGWCEGDGIVDVEGDRSGRERSMFEII